MFVNRFNGKGFYFFVNPAKAGIQGDFPFLKFFLDTGLRRCDVIKGRYDVIKRPARRKFKRINFAKI